MFLFIYTCTACSFNMRLIIYNLYNDYYYDSMRRTYHAFRVACLLYQCSHFRLTTRRIKYYIITCRSHENSGSDVISLYSHWSVLNSKVEKRTSNLKSMVQCTSLMRSCDSIYYSLCVFCEKHSVHDRLS